MHQAGNTAVFPVGNRSHEDRGPKARESIIRENITNFILTWNFSEDGIISCKLCTYHMQMYFLLPQIFTQWDVVCARKKKKEANLGGNNWLSNNLSKGGSKLVWDSIFTSCNFVFYYDLFLASALSSFVICLQGAGEYPYPSPQCLASVPSVIIPLWKWIPHEAFEEGRAI